MKIYDAVTVTRSWRDFINAKPGNIYQVGLWSEDVEWKSLIGDDYTHVRTAWGLFVMGKYGPAGEPIKEDEPC